MALSLAMMAIPGAQGLAASLGSGLGASGALASGIGNALIGTGIGAIGGASGKDLLKNALISMAVPTASKGLTAAGLSSGIASAATGGLASALRGGSAKDILLSGVAGGVAPTNPNIAKLINVFKPLIGGKG